MIKRDLGPVRFVVAIRAFRTETFLVNVVLYVTGNAFTGGIPVPVVRFVTIHTSCFDVFTKQFEISENVIERLFVKTENIGVSAFVIRVAGCTLIGARTIRLAVKSCSST